MRREKSAAFSSVLSDFFCEQAQLLICVFCGICESEIAQGSGRRAQGLDVAGLRGLGKKPTPNFQFPTSKVLIVSGIRN